VVYLCRMNNKNISKGGKPKLTVLEKKAEYGIYVWQMEHNGKAFGDGSGNVMNIPGRPHDLEAMAKIQRAAQYYGAPEGKALFMPGIRRVTDEEHSEQIDRMKQGYIPSETDTGAWLDAARGYNKNGSE
jgi:hypothetical protein